jgi:hypothetical protein
MSENKPAIDLEAFLNAARSTAAFSGGYTECAVRDLAGQYLSRLSAMAKELADASEKGGEAFRLAVFHQERADTAEAQVQSLRAERDALRGQVPRWIPVSERLPDTGLTVWITYYPYNSRSNAVAVQRAMLTQHGHWATEDGSLAWPPIEWRHCITEPRPSPPAPPAVSDTPEAVELKERPTSCQCDEEAWIGNGSRPVCSAAVDDHDYCSKCSHWGVCHPSPAEGKV